MPTQPSKTKTITKTDTKKSENRFFHDVEGLRGIAVALVVLFHAGVPHMAGGFVGVDVFFVISGFLITGLLLREFERNRAGLVQGVLCASRTPHHSPGCRGHRGDGVDRRLVS